MIVDPSKKPIAHRKGKGRRKINIEFIADKSRRLITFSKRKAGIMKKAYELATLTGTQVLLLVASETGHVYTFATPKLQPLITKQEGKAFIQSCLNTPDDDITQEFEHVQHKEEYDTDYVPPPTNYMPPPVQNNNQFYGGAPYQPFQPEAPNPYSGGHYPPREQYDFPEYGNEGYPGGNFQTIPPDFGGGYPRQMPPFGGHGYPGMPGPPPPHDLPPPGYHTDYSREFPPPPPTDYSGYNPLPYDYSDSRTNFGPMDHPEMHMAGGHGVSEMQGPMEGSHSSYSNPGAVEAGLKEEGI